MADSCATCFFFRAYSSSRPALAGVTTCRNDAPKKTTDDSESPWAIVYADEWCGDGKDGGSQRPFSPKAYSPTIPTNAGSFAMVAASTVHVVDATCTPASVINAWVTAGTGLPSLRFTPGAGSFDVFTADGSNVTGTWAYLLY